MKLLLNTHTRAGMEGDPFAHPLCEALLTECGATLIACPMLRIESQPHATAAIAGMLQRNPDAMLIITSSHAAQLLPAAASSAERIVIAVGQKTALRAVQKGYRHARAYGETVEDVLDYLCHVPLQERRKIVYVRGRHIRRNIAPLLRNQGWNVEEITVYDAEMAAQLPSAACHALTHDGSCGVALFSARAAAQFSVLLRTCSPSRKPAAFCLSDAIAATLDVSDWQVIAAATHPTAENLSKLIEIYSKKGIWGE